MTVVWTEEKRGKEGGERRDYHRMRRGTYPSGSPSRADTRDRDDTTVTTNVRVYRRVYTVGGEKKSNLQSLSSGRKRGKRVDDLDDRLARSSSLALPFCRSRAWIPRERTGFGAGLSRHRVPI